MTDEGRWEDQVLALDNQTCFALYAANRAVTALYRPLLAQLGLTYPQYLVMLVLWEAETSQDMVKVSFLGRRLRLDTGTLTPLLKRLENQGLIWRRRDDGDERVVRLGLTEDGRNLKAQARTVPGQLLCSSGLEPGRLASLRDELRSLLEQLEEGPSGESP
ncbi:MarR family winged helix-turn-helix transcriptional regulator [Marinobacter zhejiangensis]|uniref:DNA-binding transcriptional regulator, MarR family n=1 Tax=Marinobacter zhejiangensis TaxID=488535 RepID=A0A1I4RGP7_9GAMM|nr:MarR family transcriptional regulator [Marinobacter zhejiangensis]SFM51452.1 DNA-binding transcriptional regulator, MarR family [Marinobacter zhejiangensis]